ncbi:MAG: hypothetical protein JKY67_18705 [Pseudomonadales bacterium]|nr:hypothetical protein [Pseudomonadales bacterium]
MKTITLSFLLFLSLNTAAFAGIAIVVNPGNAINDVSKEDLSKIFLAKTSTFANGQKIELFDLEEGDELRDKFYKEVTNKSASQIRSFWTRLIFTGKGTPPAVLLDSEEIVTAVAESTNGIGYVDLDAVNDTVKVIMTISN